MKLTKKEAKIINDNFVKKGEERQRIKLLEELSELLVECFKNRTIQMQQELADVWVVLFGFGIDLNLECFESNNASPLICTIDEINSDFKSISSIDWSFLCLYCRDLSIVEKTIKEKIKRMEYRNNQVEPFEFMN